MRQRHRIEWSTEPISGFTEKGKDSWSKEGASMSQNLYQSKQLVNATPAGLESDLIPTCLLFSGSWKLTTSSLDAVLTKRIPL